MGLKHFWRKIVKNSTKEVLNILKSFCRWTLLPSRDSGGNDAIWCVWLKNLVPKDEGFAHVWLYAMSNPPPSPREGGRWGFQLTDVITTRKYLLTAWLVKVSNVFKIIKKNWCWQSKIKSTRSEEYICLNIPITKRCNGNGNCKNWLTYKNCLIWHAH